MRRTRRHGGRGDNPSQLEIEWSVPTESGQAATSPLPAPCPPLVQRLPWDFKSTFPQPTPQAIDAGIVSDEDAEPENVRAIHDEHARELLMVLHDLDAVHDARRSGVDPSTGRKPATPAAKDRLEKLFASEPDRLERWWRTLMESYESAFGPEATDAFGKAVRAWHAGIEVIAAPPESPPAVKADPAVAQPAVPVTGPPPACRLTQLPGMDKMLRRGRTVAHLPVPKPLPSAIVTGRFGQEEDGRSVRPGPHEVRAITEQHAEKLIDLLAQLAVNDSNRPDQPTNSLLEQFQSALAVYAEDFGERAAQQLEAYARRQSRLDQSASISPKWRR